MVEPGSALLQDPGVVPHDGNGRSRVSWSFNPALAWGVDPSAKTWINGRELKLVEGGLAPIGRPWEFEATEAIRFGQPNLIIVKISNRQLSELGTGGITGPAMLWAAGKEK